MASVMKVMRGTTAGWNDKEAEGTRLGAGQIGYNKDTKELKVGDGTTLFASLPNINAGVDPNIYKSNGIHEPNGEINFYNDTITSAALLSIKNGNIIPGGGYELGADGYSWTKAWVKNISANDDIILNAIGANGADMKQIQLRLMTADEDPMGVRSLIFDQNAFYPYNSTTLGSNEHPWASIHSTDSLTFTTKHTSYDDDPALGNTWKIEGSRDDSTFEESEYESLAITIRNRPTSTSSGKTNKHRLVFTSNAGNETSAFSSALYPEGDPAMPVASIQTSLGTEEKPWNGVYVSFYGLKFTTGDMRIWYNSTEQAIEFLAE